MRIKTYQQPWLLKQAWQKVQHKNQLCRTPSLLAVNNNKFIINKMICVERKTANLTFWVTTHNLQTEGSIQELISNDWFLTKPWNKDTLHGSPQRLDPKKHTYKKSLATRVDHDSKMYLTGKLILRFGKEVA